MTDDEISSARTPLCFCHLKALISSSAITLGSQEKFNEAYTDTVTNTPPKGTEGEGGEEWAQAEFHTLRYEDLWCGVSIQLMFSDIFSV